MMGRLPLFRNALFQCFPLEKFVAPDCLRRQIDPLLDLSDRRDHSLSNTAILIVPRLTPSSWPAS